MSAVAWQRIEGALIAAAGLLLAILVGPGWPWWLWPLLLLAPDLTMAGYAGGPRVGAAIYNLGHLYAGGLILSVAGVVLGMPGLIAGGAIWLAHIGIDRALGYGLKGPGGFQDTHLGRIGRKG